jgi:hypothetical protein
MSAHSKPPRSQTEVNRARRARGVCVNGDERPIHKGGRCEECWDKKLASDRARYQFSAKYRARKAAAERRRRKRRARGW